MQVMPTIAAAHWPMIGTDRSELPGTHGIMRRVPVKAGHIATRHHHDFEQFLFIVSGGGRLECEQGAIPLTPGTALRLEAGAWHSAEFTADTVLIEMNLQQPTA